MMNRLHKSKGNVFLVVVIVLLVLLLIALGTWFMIKKSKQQNTTNNSSQVSLVKVTYTTQNPSLPPQFSQAKTMTYSDQSDINKINTLLKTNNISQINPTDSKGCTGGTNYQYSLVYSDNSTVEYREYKCANSYAGNMGGNAAGFITGFSQEFDK